MSMQLEQGRTEFLIKTADKAAALAAVQALTTRTYGTRAQRREQANTFGKGSCRLPGTGRRKRTRRAISSMWHSVGEKVAEADKLFAALAPFVDSGSYIEVQLAAEATAIPLAV